jgi:hypothetical protein
MTLVKQISSVCRSSFMHLRIIHRAFRFLTCKQISILCHSLVISRIHYCSSLYFGVSKKQLSRLQRIVASVQRLILRRNSHSSELSHIPAVTDIVKTKVATLCYKALNKMTPSFLSELIIPVVSARRLRSISQELLEVPFVSTAMGGRAFSVAAPRTWNDLPVNIRRSHTLSLFISSLYVHFSSTSLPT